MKILVFLLVLANLLFYAFTEGVFGRPGNPDAGRAEQQVQPDRLRIVSRGEAPAKPAVEAKVETPVVADDEPVCVAWPHLSAADADRLAALLAERHAGFRLSRQAVAGEGSGWWVYVPPLASKAEAERKAAELRGLGVADYFPIQEGPNRNAISLGIFSSQKGAQERLAELRTKGVRSARIAPRPGKDGSVSLRATGPASAREALLASVEGILPRAEVQACK